MHSIAVLFTVGLVQKPPFRVWANIFGGTVYEDILSYTSCLEYIMCMRFWKYFLIYSTPYSIILADLNCAGHDIVLPFQAGTSLGLSMSILPKSLLFFIYALKVFSSDLTDDIFFALFYNVCQTRLILVVLSFGIHS